MIRQKPRIHSMGSASTQEVEVLASSFDTFFALCFGILCKGFRVYWKLHDRTTPIEAINGDRSVSAVYFDAYGPHQQCATGFQLLLTEVRCSCAYHYDPNTTYVQ